MNQGLLADRPGLLDSAIGAVGELRVEVRDGARVVSQQSITGHSIIGRAADAAIRLDRGTVSRQHAEVFPDPFGRWWIRDRGSRNGLLLAGRRVQERPIRNGDQFQVGDFSVAFTVPGTDDATDAESRTSQTTIVPVVDGVTAGGISLAHDLEPPRLAAAHLSMLLEAGRELIRIDDAEARLVTLCQLLVRPDFKGTSALAVRVMPGQLDAPVSLCPPQSIVGHGGRPPVSRSLLLAVIQRNAAAMAGSGATPSEFSPEMVEMSIIASARPLCAVACPLKPVVEGQPADLLYVLFPPECASGEWLAIVALAAEQYRLAETAWAARHEAARHAAVERDLEQARQIQLRLVPRDLRVSGLEVAVGFQPCRWVGGDYTDAAVLPDGRVLLAVADVCGKGLGAALVASSLHILVRSMMFDGPVALDRMLARLNRHLGSHLSDGRFVTMACAIVDPATGEVEHANAGHPPTLIIGPDASAIDLACGDNLPLGIEEAEQFCVSKHHLSPGQTLAMYTDGLSEARTAAGEMLGIEGVRRELAAIHAACRAEPLDAARARVTAWIESVSGGRLQDDDRTYLLARKS